MRNVDCITVVVIIMSKTFCIMHMCQHMPMCKCLYTYTRESVFIIF